MLSSVPSHLLAILDVPGITYKERLHSTDFIEELQGPVLDTNCTHICEACLKSIQNSKIPNTALANGLWIGDVTDELQGVPGTQKLHKY